jgi:hypothetical protein
MIGGKNRILPRKVQVLHMGWWLQALLATISLPGTNTPTYQANSKVMKNINSFEYGLV